MHAHHRHDSQAMTRRMLLAAAIGTLVGMVSRGSHAPMVRVASATTQRDVCYWENVGASYCSGGRRYQRRCEVCCAGGVCETVQCIIVDLGPC